MSKLYSLLGAVLQSQHRCRETLLPEEINRMAAEALQHELRM